MRSSQLLRLGRQCLLHPLGRHQGRLLLLLVMSVVMVVVVVSLCRAGLELRIGQGQALGRHQHQEEKGLSREGGESRHQLTYFN